MIDKAEFRIPYSANFRSEFKFVPNEVRYAGFCSSMKRAQRYQGTCDLRPFGIDAILHAYLRRSGARNHKLEILESGKKTLDEIGGIIASVFDVNPGDMPLMRLDCAADMFGVPLLHLHRALRVKFKRSSNERGELDYELVGGRRLEYFRYGKSPNCVRTYDKPAECKSRLPEILKRSNPEAEPPSFLDIFGFPEDTVMTRVERQIGGGRVPQELATFRHLYRAGNFNPFTQLHLVQGEFTLPDPRQYGDARSLKLAGIHTYVNTYGYQAARAMFNAQGNAKRLMDDYEAYLAETQSVANLSLEKIVETFRSSVNKQINGSLTKHGIGLKFGPKRALTEFLKANLISS